MLYDNFKTRIKKELLAKIIRAFQDDRLDELDRIPIEERPIDGEHSRCCIYLDRAIIKYRCMALLGMSIEDEQDELTSLAQYAQQALKRDKINLPVLTVIHEGCKACVPSHIEVTNACHGCFASPCILNCPRNAIEKIDGKAWIDPKKCVFCGKCIAVCPFHAIIRIPIPCEEACPVKAITKDETGREKIDYSKCIFCGNCMRACPFGVIMERSQIIEILQALKSGKPVVAAVAPAIAGQFSCDISQLAPAIKKLGFAGMAEVASGADATSRKEADEFIERIQRGNKLMTSSCCPAYDEAVAKHIPELKDCISNTPTPMHFIAEKIKEENPDAITVFVGPCVAKRKEGIDDPVVDYVLSFEELDALFEVNGIDPSSESGEQLSEPAHWQGRGFPVSGGTTKAIESVINGREEFKPVLVDGLNKKNLNLLKAYASGKCPGNFIEVMSCEGGCVGGPAVVMSPEKATVKIKKLADDSISITPGAKE